jgi:hypothetical protein
MHHPNYVVILSEAKDLSISPIAIDPSPHQN